MDDRVVGTFDLNKRPNLVSNLGLGPPLCSSVHCATSSSCYRLYNHIRHLRYVEVLYVVTEDDGVTGTLVPVPPHHVYSTLTHQHGDDPCPAVLREPLLLERQGALALLVFPR